VDRQLIDRIARAVLYEGYMLYPYRPSSLKNSKRLTFGTLDPGARFHCECLLRGSEVSGISVVVRFLHLGAEREFSVNVRVGEILSGRCRESFSFGELERVEGEVGIGAAQVAPGVFKISAEVRNTTGIPAPLRSRLGSGASESDGELVRSLVSAHAVLSAQDGEFVSMTDPPAEFAEIAAACVNTGVWPVLVERDTVLASPIILSDYPEVAPESAGDLFDATEIEEILTLRILTLTDAEKEEVRRSDAHARRILERAESLPAAHLMKLHGTIRTVRVRGVDLKTGDRVRLWPNRRADIMDTVLEGKTAVIEAIEQDFEDNVQLAVVVEDDPGRDLGEMRQIGHRFFFSPSEVEPVRNSR
jgi:hypothetical protein